MVLSQIDALSSCLSVNHSNPLKGSTLEIVELKCM